MTIAFVGTRGIPYQTSRDRLEYNLEAIATNLAKKNHAVFVFGDPNYSSKKIYKGVKVIPAKPSISALLRKLRKIPDLDVVHIMSIDCAWLAFWISIWMPQIRIIFEYHNYTFSNNRQNRQKYRLLTYISAQFSDSLITDNLSLHKLLNRNFQTKLHLVESGIEIPTSQIDPRPRLEDIYPKPYILINSCLYKDSKSLDLWLKAYQKHSIQNDFYLIILGKVHPYIKQNYTDQKINFVGQLAGMTERILIQKAHTFIELAENNEDRLPLYLALLSGVPVIASDSISNQWLVARAARFFTTQNYSSIITQLNTLEDMYPLLKGQAMNYIPEIEDRLSLKGRIHKYLFIYLNTFEKKFKQTNQLSKTHSIPVLSKS